MTRHVGVQKPRSHGLQRDYAEALGYHLGEFDPIPALFEWVERGTAPRQIVASGPGRARPVFPYPLRAKYDGSGSVDDAANFKPSGPLRPTQDTIRWEGENLYR